MVDEALAVLDGLVASGEPATLDGQR